MTHENGGDDGSYLQFVYDWTIDNCRRLRRFKTGEAIKSYRFITSACNRSLEWRIELYPNGFTTEHRGWLSVFLLPLTPMSSETDVVARGFYTLAIINSDFAPVNVQQSQTTDFVTAKGVGHARYLPMDMDEMFNTGFIHAHDDTLFLQYRLSLSRRAFTQPSVTPIVMPPPADSQGESRFAGIDSPNKSSFDIILTANDWGKFFCHRQDIEDVSDEMRKRCEKAVSAFEKSGNRKTRAPELQISTASTPMLKEVLRFVYTRRINTIADLREILATAKDWNDDDLLEYAARVACERASVDNCVELYLCAVEFDRAALKARALQLILLNLAAVSQTSGWPRLVKKPKLVQRIFDKAALHHAVFLACVDADGVEVNAANARRDADA